MKLTDAKLRSLKATGKTQKFSDEGGLYLHLSPSGGKLWRLAYRFGGKQKTLALGQYPAVSLVEARKRREEARELLTYDNARTILEAAHRYLEERGELRPEPV